MTRFLIRRAVAVLAVATLVVGSIGTTPAIGGTFLTKKKALKLFYTKQQADARFHKRLDNVVTVSPSGGDFTSVQAAIDAVTDASATNPYLVLVGPGTYTGRVVLEPGITVQGAGLDATFLEAPGAAACADAYVVKSASNATVTDLTVRNTGGAACSVGILSVATFGGYRDVNVFALGGTSFSIGVRVEGSDGGFSLNEVRVVATTAVGAAGADAIGVDVVGATNGDLVVTRSLVRADSAVDGDAIVIQNNGGQVAILQSELRAGNIGTGDKIGISDTDATNSVRVRNSTVRGGTNTITSNGSVQVALSQLDGGPVIATGGATCAGVYSQTFVFSASTCP